MTNVRCLIKYSPNIIEVTSGLKDRTEIWRKATDGIGKFRVLLLGSWVNQFAPNDPIQIRFDDIIVFEGYIDKGTPLAENDAYNQFYELVGRDYGQDLLNKQVNKTGVWMYGVQTADLIIDDMLSKANSEITFTPSGDHKYGTGDVIPSIAYTDTGDEYLIEAFRKIFEQINYDFYVDANKALQIFPIGSVDSGIDLKCVAGVAGNNLLNLQKTEFDDYDLRNYIIAKSNKVDDGWTDGNAADFTGTTGNIISDDFTQKLKGMGSIKCVKNTGADISIVLSFPKHNYTSLPFDIFKEEVLNLAYRFTGYETLSIPRLELILEDTDGHKIHWRVAHQQLTTDMWFQLSVPIGTLASIVGYNNWMGIAHNDTVNQWQYDSVAYNTFSWKIVKITFANWTQAAWPTTLWIDSLSIPLPMISVKQDAESQGLYGVRRHSTSPKYVRTQSELDAYAASELAKRKDPLYALHVTALGSAGIIEGAFKWIPGWTLNVNSPADGINGVDYRISEAHCVVSEAGQSGHDFIVEADLIPKASLISGKRLSGVLTPEIALLRELSEKIRAQEKTEEVGYDYLPPLPDDAASKILVGDFGSLEDTAVAFTRQWEAEEGTLTSPWAVVDDAAAHGGHAVAATGAGAGEKIKILDGLLGDVGEFYAIMRVKTSHLDATKMVELKITNKDSPYDVLNSVEIKGENFPTANKYHAFAMRVEIPANKQNLEIAVLYWGTSGRTIHCDYVALVPADVPLGYSDVTVADAHGVLAALAASHSTVTVITSGHTTEAVIASAHSTVTVISSAHSTTTAIASSHQNVTVVADAHSTTTAITSAHGTATVISNTHSTSTVIQTAHTNVTVVASAHSTTAVISNTHSTATVISNTHSTSTVIATAHGTVTVIADLHGTSTLIQDAHGIVTAIGSAPSQSVGGWINSDINITVGSGSWTEISTPYCAVDVDLWILETLLRCTAASFSGRISTYIRIHDETTGLYYPSSTGLLIPMWSDIYNYYAHAAVFTIPRNTHGDTLHLQFYQTTGANMQMAGGCTSWGHSPHTHGVTTQPAQHPVQTQPAVHGIPTQPSGHPVDTQPSGQSVTTQPSGQSVTTQPADHTVSTQPSGHPVTTQPSGQTVTTQPEGHTVATQPSVHPVTTQPSGHPVDTHPTGHTVSTQPAGHSVTTQPAGHVVSTQPSGHSVSTQPSGHSVVDPAHEH